MPNIMVSGCFYSLKRYPLRPLLTELPLTQLVAKPKQPNRKLQVALLGPTPLAHSTSYRGVTQTIRSKPTGEHPIAVVDSGSPHQHLANVLLPPCGTQVSNDF